MRLAQQHESLFVMYALDPSRRSEIMISTQNGQRQNE